MRSYSGLLVFESVFDSIPTQETLLSSFAKSIFSPTVKIVENDCETMLGRRILLETYAEGNTRTDTGTLLSRGYIDTLLGNGVYQTYTRTLDSCVAKDGVCLTCYRASRPYLPVPSVGNNVSIDPDYVSYEEFIEAGRSGDFMHAYTSQDITTADHYAVYTLGTQVANFTAVPSTPDTPNGKIVIPYDSGVEEGSPAYAGYYTVRAWVEDRTPFMYWLASTYSGSLLGMKALIQPPLNVRPSLLTSSISEGQVQEVYEYVKRAGRAPGDLLEYAGSIPSLLEKALFVLALGIIYSPYA